MSDNATIVAVVALWAVMMVALTLMDPPSVMAPYSERQQPFR